VVGDTRRRPNPTRSVRSATARHLPQCEYVSETNPAVLKILLTAKPGTGGDYWWVTCAGCEGSWQVPFYAAERAGTG
jgi:hypothetical protein